MDSWLIARARVFGEDTKGDLERLEFTIVDEEGWFYLVEPKEGWEQHIVSENLTYFVDPTGLIKIKQHKEPIQPERTVWAFFLHDREYG